MSLNLTDDEITVNNDESVSVTKDGVKNSNFAGNEIVEKNTDGEGGTGTGGTTADKTNPTVPNTTNAIVNNRVTFSNKKEELDNIPEEKLSYKRVPKTADVSSVSKELAKHYLLLEQV